MAVIYSVLKEELERLLALRARATAERAALPHGSVVIKTKSGRRYAYLAHREGHRVVTDYVGPEASPHALQLAATLNKRRKITAEIKAVDVDIADLRRMLHLQKVTNVR